MKSKKRVDKKVNKIVKRIKEIKIQGATNIAKAALKAYVLSPTSETKKKLISARPTEPALVNTINALGKLKPQQIIEHFDKSKQQMNKNVFKLIKSGKVYFTHCHSSNVVNALIYAKKKGKNFEVYNTETRPLFQGRIAAKRLSRVGIKVTNFVDSAAAIALEPKQNTKKVDAIFLGADAILSNGDVINKLGSGMISEVAKLNKIPVYIVSDSWKFTKRPVKIEERAHKEVWKSAPKKIKVRNPAFETIKKKYITKIISEFGVLTPDQFLKKATKN